MKTEDLYFGDEITIARENGGMGLDKVSAFAVGFSKKTDETPQADIKSIIRNAEQKDLDICLKPDAGILGIYYQNLQKIIQGGDKEILGEKLQEAKMLVTFSHENPLDALIGYDYYKFYDSSLGTFTQPSKEKAAFPHAVEKCEGVAHKTYDAAKSFYNITNTSSGRPVFQYIMDSAFKYFEKAANLYIGYDEHPWGLRNDQHRQHFTNIVTDGGGIKKEDRNEDAGQFSEEVSYKANLFNPNWDYYEHAQWARVYAKVIGSKFKQTAPTHDFFANTKLLTINDTLVLNARKSQTQFDIDNVFGSEDKDAIISITDTEIIINDVEKSDQSNPHEIDFYSSCGCFSRSPDSKWLNYANSITRECLPCWEFVRDEVQRRNDGGYIYTIKVHDVSQASDWDDANSRFYSKNMCGSPQNCLFHKLNLVKQGDTYVQLPDPNYIPNKNCWNQTAPNLDCGSNYAINGTPWVYFIPDIIEPHIDNVKTQTIFDTRANKNFWDYNGALTENSYAWYVTKESAEDAVQDFIKSPAKHILNTINTDNDGSVASNFDFLKGCGYCFTSFDEYWSNNTRPPKDRIKGFFAQHNEFVTPEEHLNAEIGDMCCGYSALFNYAAWEADADISLGYEHYTYKYNKQTNTYEFDKIVQTNYTPKAAKVGPNLCYEVINKERIQPSSEKYQAVRMLQYTG